MQTYSAKASEIQKKWVVIDAEGLVVGRLAAIIATRLRGKHKPTYTPHLDCGDNVIVVNAEKIVFTGNKMTDKLDHWHTGYIGGIKDTTPQKILGGRTPPRPPGKRGKSKLPPRPLGKHQFSKFCGYARPPHPPPAPQPPKPAVCAISPPKNTLCQRQ